MGGTSPVATALTGKPCFDQRIAIIQGASMATDSYIAHLAIQRLAASGRLKGLVVGEIPEEQPAPRTLPGERPVAGPIMRRLLIRDAFEADIPGKPARRTQRLYLSHDRFPLAV
jgi:hypothetical protein